MQNEQNDVRLQDTQRLPVQAPPVMRGAIASVVSGEAGLEVSDYNDPVYFFLNWPASI